MPGPAKRGQTSRKVVGGQCRALLAFAGIQRHDGRQRGEGAGADADDDRSDDHHHRVRAEPLRNVVEGDGTDGERRATEPTHRPHPSIAVHEPAPERC